MRALGLAVIAALMLAASGSAPDTHPSAAWLVQAQCVHHLEGPWTANTGNGYFGGMQFSPQTWKRVHGAAKPAFQPSRRPRVPVHGIAEGATAARMAALARRRAQLAFVGRSGRSLLTRERRREPLERSTMITRRPPRG